MRTSEGEGTKASEKEARDESKEQAYACRNEETRLCCGAHHRYHLFPNGINFSLFDVITMPYVLIRKRFFALTQVLIGAVR